MGQAMFWVTQHCGKDEIWISLPGSGVLVVTKVLGIGRGQFSRVCQVVDDNEFVV